MVAMQQRIGLTYSSNAGAMYRRMAPTFPYQRAGFLFAESNPARDDWLAVTNDLSQPFATHVPMERRILVISEPSPMNGYPPEYINQFGVLLSPYRIDGFLGSWHPSHAALPWFFGFPFDHGPSLSFSELVDLPPPQKRSEVSVVVSNKVFHQGHRNRLRFLNRLQSRLGSRLHVFGRGIREINDKAEAILPFAYHLALENSIETNSFTEKFSDAFLGYALPLYAGCPNASEWFPSESFVALDLDDLDSAIDQVQQALDDDLYAGRLGAIQEARRRVLHQQTIFDVLQRAAEAFPSDCPRMERPKMVHPIAKKKLMSRLKRECSRLYHRATFRETVSSAS